MADTVTFRPTDDQGGFIEGLISSGDYSNQKSLRVGDK
jgi:antitoxin ParD1/3/4